MGLVGAAPLLGIMKGLAIGQSDINPTANVLLVHRLDVAIFRIKWH